MAPGKKTVAKTCSFCKKGFADGEAVGYGAAIGYTHKACLARNSGPFGFLADIVFPFWNPSSQAGGMKLLLYVLIAGFGVLALFSIVVFGLFIGNWTLVGQLLLLCAFALVALSPILYSFYAFLKDK
jgi:hypothetical protein